LGVSIGHYVGYLNRSFRSWYDSHDPSKAGKLRLMYEANPMSFIIEQAGGMSSTGHGRILEVESTGLHQRVPVVLGSAKEVARVEEYYLKDEKVA